MADKYFEYKTRQGDTFDMIALDVYNEERKAHIIIQAYLGQHRKLARNVLVNLGSN